MPEYGVSLGCDDNKTYNGLIFTNGAIQQSLVNIHSIYVAEQSGPCTYFKATRALLMLSMGYEPIPTRKICGSSLR